MQRWSPILLEDNAMVIRLYGEMQSPALTCSAAQSNSAVANVGAIVICSVGVSNADLLGRLLPIGTSALRQISKTAYTNLRLACFIILQMNMH